MLVTSEESVLAKYFCAKISLPYKHRIPKGEETVFFLHGGFVGFQDIFAAGEGGHHHEEGGFGEVEVGDDGVGDFPFVAGIDVEARPIAAGFHAAALAGRFQRADGRGADGDDAAPFFFRAVYGGGDVLGDGVPFAMHFVVFDIFFGNGAESADADVERHEMELGAFGAHFVQERRREMEAGRGRCCRAFVFRVDGLVLIFIRQFFVNVGRRRHFSYLVQERIPIAFIGETDEPAAEFRFFQHFARNLIRKGNDLTRQRFSSRIDEAFPQ